ncbi:RNA chaperone Hfq [Bacillus pseudomycoides]|uniref:RNA chaperone Hfq n=1 Tax=Bacillus pseudomycoides TaxID=64104 RepID=UPI000BF0C908|nr:RNA chaperone Hfq [Bacillus pseudomycoides]PEO39974.1 RNA chaperone Hfq [Bacillus pseudomycoides]
MNGLQKETYELLKEKKEQITVFLKSGVRITGQILAMDKFTILMMVRGKQQLVYKQAVSTITK